MNGERGRGQCTCLLAVALWARFALTFSHTSLPGFSRRPLQICRECGRFRRASPSKRSTDACPAGHGSFDWASAGDVARGECRVSACHEPGIEHRVTKSEAAGELFRFVCRTHVDTDARDGWV